MKRPKRAPILTLDELEIWLDTVEPPAHCRVSMMNGFLTGLAAGPVFLSPNDWMWHVIGDHEKRAYIGNKVQAVIDTIVDHYNLIAHQLESPGAYAPLLMRTDEGEVLAGEWADGFFGAIHLTFEAWLPLFQKKETGEPAMAILLHCTKPEMTAMMGGAFPKPSEAVRQDSWRALPFAVEAIYAHCAPTRSNPGAPANEA
jgi:uncharacterized protein